MEETLTIALAKGRLAEQTFDLLREGVGGNVPVLRFSAEKGVPHTAAHGISLVSGLRKGLQDLFYLLGNLHVKLHLHVDLILHFRLHERA